MNELTQQTRVIALGHAITKALHKDPATGEASADDIVADAVTFYKFLKKEDNQP